MGTRGITRLSTAESAGTRGQVTSGACTVRPKSTQECTSRAQANGLVWAAAHLLFSSSRTHVCDVSDLTCTENPLHSAHLCCHVSLSSSVNRLFLSSFLHRTPLAHSPHGAFSQDHTCFSAEKLPPTVLARESSSVRSSGVFLSHHRVPFCHRITSFLSLLRHFVLGCRVVTHFVIVRSRWSLAGDPPFHWLSRFQVFAFRTACRLVALDRLSVHAGTTDVARLAARQNVVCPARSIALLHVARKSQRVQRLRTWDTLSCPIPSPLGLQHPQLGSRSLPQVSPTLCPHHLAVASLLVWTSTFLGATFLHSLCHLSYGI